jgi:Heterokaryon incompatibility protein (HET)
MAINTESGLDQLDEWIKECKADHPRCQRARELRKNEKPFIPTRLIELIGPSPEGGRLRLIETSEWSDEQYSRPYLTLSHCWGDPEMFKMFCTYPDDVKEFLVNIELAKLPKTFENVMRLAWRLGISYVWIDSICVIQGPKGDFNIEAQLVIPGYESVVVLFLSLYIHPIFLERPPELPFGANRYHDVLG